MRQKCPNKYGQDDSLIDFPKFKFTKVNLKIGLEEWLRSDETYKPF